MCQKEIKNSGMNRRELLAALGMMGASMLVSCNPTNFTNATTTSANDSGDSSSGSSGSCTEAASETNGPYPADGSNTAGDGTSTKLDKIYTGSPIIRSNIIESQRGVPLTLNITLENAKNSCAILNGYYIYIWHCTAAGVYSAYTASTNGGSHSSSETYLRGIQQTNSSGEVSFSTIYPGWYSGRAVHIHVEVYAGLDDASPVKITQLAFPNGTTQTVMAQTSYGYKGTSGMLTNSSDNIFSDGTSTEMLSVSGSVSAGYTASITLGVSV